MPDIHDGRSQALRDLWPELHGQLVRLAAIQRQIEGALGYLAIDDACRALDDTLDELLPLLARTFPEETADARDES